tara:strand:+ start:189 stop:767 length:579 start_codon:yes stop_codon:yes gene_type:complete
MSTTKIVQALEAVIELHFNERSDEEKSDLLDGIIDEILRKEIYKSIKKPTRKEDDKKIKGGKPRGSTAYQLFQMSMKGKGSQRDIADMWAEAKENDPDFVAFLKIQATKKNNGEEWSVEMPEEWIVWNDDEVEEVVKEVVKEVVEEVEEVVEEVVKEVVEEVEEVVEEVEKPKKKKKTKKTKKKQEPEPEPK